ncbi:alkaline phosphatase [Microbulbifer mangrovi]|uniref:alkaline phosphatase n=1 Tax=Microbulbifer mangrovi TaxID=927787 RepID=UPI0009906E3F|nr:alkaline phosphatase [Microbulbifer mangrovi]
MIQKTLTAVVAATLTTVSTAALLGGCHAGVAEDKATKNTVLLQGSQRASHWFSEGEEALQRAATRPINNQRGSAKNIILFVGDGMGISTVTAARILAGQQQGLAGEEYQLSFEQFPYAGLIKTYNTNQQTPDSAGTATAMVTGVKTKAGVLSVDESVARGDCAASLEAPLTTALELAEGLGKSTGLVSTARVTHATPGATYAKVPERGWEHSAPEGCKDIASQLVELPVGDGVDVVMGGGRRNFLPKEMTDLEGQAGKREDGRNLIEAWKARYASDAQKPLYIEDRKGFDGIDVASTEKLLGLFESSHMRYEADRKNDIAGEPALHEMTAKAIDLLGKNDSGYFLLVEGGRIDHGHHAGSAYNALNDAVELARAVQVAVDKTRAEDTLIIVTADHSHVMTIAGYPTRGNPILGKVVGNDRHGQAEQSLSLAADGKPYTTIGYTTGLGHAHYGDETDADVRYDDPIDSGRKDLTELDTTASGYHQDSLVPLGSETHGGEDVGIWARGPGAHLLSGTNEQSFIFHVMAHSGGLLK